MPRWPSGCKCKPCILNRAYARNYYYHKTGQLDRIEKLPEVTTKEWADCFCDWCIRRREAKNDWSKLRRAKRQTLDIITLERPDDSTIHKGFKQYGPGRYEWDRTTERDYGRTIRSRETGL